MPHLTCATYWRKKISISYLYLFFPVYKFLTWVSDDKEIKFLYSAYARQLPWQNISFVLLQPPFVLLHPALNFCNILQILIIFCGLTTWMVVRVNYYGLFKTNLKWDFWYFCWKPVGITWPQPYIVYME